MGATVATTGSLAESVAAVKEWYREQTGRDLGDNAHSRTLAILLFLERRGLRLEQCSIHLSTDPGWPARRGRTPAEAAAERIGTTQVRGKTGFNLWIFSPDAPDNGAED